MKRSPFDPQFSYLTEAFEKAIKWFEDQMDQIQVRLPVALYSQGSGIPLAEMERLGRLRRPMLNVTYITPPLTKPNSTDQA